MTHSLLPLRCIAAILLLAACEPVQQEERFTATRTEYSALDGWMTDDHAAARAAFVVSCQKLYDKPQATTEESQITIGREAWEKPCVAAQKIANDTAAARLFFEHYFTPFTITNNDEPEGLFTGYYEPLLYGARAQGGDFRYPVYGRPDDLIEGTPYLTREQIETQGLEKKAPVLAWVEDPAMLFFMQVQGSGRIRFMQGPDMRVGFAGRNGHGYQSVGKIMREEGLVPEDQLDFFGIRQWLYKNPTKARAMMWRNPSYIFFREMEGDGPVGGAGVALTPGRSLAVDKRYIPYGLPLFVQTELPAGPGREAEPLNRLMIAQDTGGAIKGPVRGDVFFGYGDDAEYYAGRMKSQGRATLLVPKAVASQLE
ncbi:MAG: murein transglycosylase A [Alphaproteobacteria bacterium]